MFKTQLIGEVRSPQHLFFLDYPPVIHFHELRRAKRTTIFVPCTLKHNGGEELTGVLIDLSSMGCLFQAKVRGKEPQLSFEIDTMIELFCLLPGIKDNQILSGKVKNIKKSSTELQIGIQFNDLRDDLRQAIEKYVQSVENITRE